MHHGQNRGKQKSLIKQDIKLKEISGFINVAEIGGKCVFFGNRGNIQYASLA